jgi:hypothetical protein
MSYKFNPFTKKMDYYTSGGIGLYSNLSIKNNTTNPNYQMDISATTVLLEDSSKAILRIDTLSETVDITASGVNGLDTGSEAGSTWYHIWAIAKADGTKDCLLSTSATAPTLPAGYTYKAYLGAVYNNASGNFVSFKQYDKSVVTDMVVSLSGGAETSYTSISLATCIPTTAKKVKCIIIGTTATSISDMYISGDSAGSYEMYRCYLAATGATYIQSRLIANMTIQTSQTLYYKVSADTTGALGISGWEY